MAAKHETDLSPRFESLLRLAKPAALIGIGIWCIKQGGLGLSAIGVASAVLGFNQLARHQ